MSAHCGKCGSDFVYGPEWPLMECPVCTVQTQRSSEITDFGMFMFIVGMMLGFAVGAFFGWLIF